MRQNGIKIERNIKPDVKVNPSGIITGIGGIVVSFLTQSVANVPAYVDSFVDSFEFKDKPGKLVYQLIMQSIVTALVDLIVEKGGIPNKDFVVTEDLETALDNCILEQEYYIDADFFAHPERLTLLKDIVKPLKEFLQLLKLSTIDMENILNRFNSYFVYALTSEWRTNHTVYHELEEMLKTPLDEAYRRTLEWENYGKYLDKQIHLPMFLESFSLADVFVPLRCYYKQRIRNKEDKKQDICREEDKYNRIVVDLESHLMQWLEAGKQDDCLRIIKGGPGYGKSSCLKVLAARLANDGIRVLYIPLHLLDIKDYLQNAVKEFMKSTGFLSSDPFEVERLVIIFDGLDEFAMSDKLLADAAQSFLREVDNTIKNFNYGKLKLQVIVSGRDVIIQKNEDSFRKDGQILSLLPYFIKEDKSKYIDPKLLLATDQRDIWWDKYRSITENKFSEMPAVLKAGNLSEITALPLLNYLIAFSYQNDSDELNENTNLNSVYFKLMRKVFERSYGDNASLVSPLPSLGDITFENFCRLMEEIALVAWQGKGRTATVKEVSRHLENKRLGKLLQEFTKDAEKGVISLLAAFYFHKTGNSPDDSESFEFTHKSFGEYLAAKRFVEHIKRMAVELIISETDFDKGWDVEDCLQEWVKLFGPKDIDMDTLVFIHNEFALLDATADTEDYKSIRQLQDIVVRLMQYVIDYGLPKGWYSEFAHLGLNYKEETSFAINAERALFIIHGALADLTDQMSSLKWPQENSFRQWCGRLFGQRYFVENDICAQALHHLDYSNQSIFNKNFHFANFTKANLKRAELWRVDLWSADLISADLSGADLISAHLRGADLTKADLSGADLSRANLSGAHLSGADLSGADLRGVHLNGAVLRGVKFDESTIVTDIIIDKDTKMDDDFRKYIAKENPKSK